MQPPTEQALGDYGKKKLPLKGRNLQQTQAQREAAICHDQLVVTGKETGQKIDCERESEIIIS